MVFSCQFYDICVVNQFWTLPLKSKPIFELHMNSESDKDILIDSACILRNYSVYILITCDDWNLFCLISWVLSLLNWLWDWNYYLFKFLLDYSELGISISCSCSKIWPSTLAYANDITNHIGDSFVNITLKIHRVSDTIQDTTLGHLLFSVSEI